MGDTHATAFEGRSEGAERLVEGLQDAVDVGVGMGGAGEGDLQGGGGQVDAAVGEVFAVRFVLWLSIFTRSSEIPISSATMRATFILTPCPISIPPCDTDAEPSA